MQIINGYPISNLTTLAIGGPAKQFVEVTTEEQLIEAITYAKNNNLEYLVIGGGSNLLVADEGVDKLVIKNSIVGIVIPNPSNVILNPKDEGPSNHIDIDSGSESGMTKVEDSSATPQNDKVILTVKSGTILQDLVNFSIEHNLAGLQKLTGIPGTVGGAIYGNAGAYGQTISDHLIEVTILNPSVILARFAEASARRASEERARPESDSGVASLPRMTLTKEQCKFDYRNSDFKKNGFIILEAKFALEPGDQQTLQQEAIQTKSQRDVKYPPGIKCPGSFFKNIVASNVSQEILAKIPPEKIVYGKIPAGALLEEVDAKGATLGDIEIAPYHANLFINKGNGNAKDFYELAKQMSEKIKQKFGIILEPEVQLLNLPRL